MKTKITIEFTAKEFITALETGTLTGKKILDIEWVYGNVCTGDGRGNGTYERTVVGAIVEVEDAK